MGKDAERKKRGNKGNISKHKNLKHSIWETRSNKHNNKKENSLSHGMSTISDMQAFQEFSAALVMKFKTPGAAQKN